MKRGARKGGWGMWISSRFLPDNLPWVRICPTHVLYWLPMLIKPNLDYETILANKHQPISFALQLNADTIDTPRERSLAFCVVLDRSASMDGKPLEQAKKAKPASQNPGRKSARNNTFSDFAPVNAPAAGKNRAEIKVKSKNLY